VAEVAHSALTGTNLHVPFHYIQDADPGVVGTGKFWLDTNSGPPRTLYRRNAADDGWDEIGPTSTGSGQVSTLNFVIDGGGSAITTGVKGDLVVDFACEITAVTLLADQSGSIVVDLYKDTYANFPPTDADSITAAAPPTITTATKSQDTTLTGWTTALAAGAVMRFNVDSVTDIERCTVALTVERA
jgi:hypothetical protein